MRRRRKNLGLPSEKHHSLMRNVIWARFELNIERVWNAVRYDDCERAMGAMGEAERAAGHLAAHYGSVPEPQRLKLLHYAQDADRMRNGAREAFSKHCKVVLK